MTHPPLRTHQARALAALERGRGAGRRRSWVVLPPGAGKTRVGVETISSALAEGRASHAVVLVPNTAIQAQWVATLAAHDLAADTDRDLDTEVSCLTYQAVAVFDADAEVGDDPDSPGDAGLLGRLHPNGRKLVERLRDTDGLLLVLDECHHLLEVWGQLLAELLAAVGDAEVLGLTATPPDALTPDQAALVTDLFGDVAFRVGVPAVVKEGHLAPYAELAWLVTPTAHEERWLAEESTRWRELTTHLTDPAFGSLPFLEWVTRRFVEPVPATWSWADLARTEPELSEAALRLAHAGLVALPEGARLLEQHRRPPSPDDWVALLDDWVTEHLVGSDDPRDAEVVERVRAALPSVGHVLTRRGIRRGRTPVDRVLARSHAKTVATVEVVAHELAALGSRTRVLVLCDHERASATLPTGLEGVLDAQSGSAWATLERLVADPATAALSPLLVTGSTVAGAPATLAALADHVAASGSRWAGRLVVEASGDLAVLGGGWSSREWVPPVTSFFESGGSQVLVGTRGLLGEGWDARRITSLVDLTTATTTTAVVQTRGRALRVDPEWPDKVAVNWTVTCVSEDHPRGDNDWHRLVRKHAGFHGVDEDGDVVDGVAHVDGSFSPYAPPPASTFDDVNRRMRERAHDRDAVRERWRVGEAYDDRLTATLRVVVPSPALPPPTEVIRASPVPLPVVVTRNGVDVRDPSLVPPPREHGWSVAGWAGVLAGSGSLLAVVVTPWFAAGGLLAGASAAALTSDRRQRREELAGWVTDRCREATAPVTVVQVAAAVADALVAVGATSVGSGALAVEVHPDGEHRVWLDASEAEASTFATALDEALAPVGRPRYLVSRAVLTRLPAPPAGRLLSIADAAAALGGVRPDAEAWHPVPDILGSHAKRAAAYAVAWRRWVGDGDVLWTGSPEGSGVLAAQHGADPMDVTTVMRRHWH